MDMDTMTVAADTVPQDQQEAVQHADDTQQDTTPAADTDAQQQDRQAQQDGGNADAQQDGTQDDGQDVAAPVIPIQFNHEYRELSINEAATWAQKGMYADKLINNLAGLAAASNADSIPALVDQLRSAHETMLLQKYTEQCGGDKDLANKLLEIDRSKWQEQAPKIAKGWDASYQEDANALNKRLAEEFLAMQKEFGIDKFDQLPAEVINSAVKNNIPLSDAYLRYQYTQHKQAQAAAESQKAAKQATPGSLQSGGDPPQQDATVAAMLQGVFRS